MIKYFHSLSLLFDNIEKSIFFKKNNIKTLDSAIYDSLYFDFLSFTNIPNDNTSAMDGYSIILNKFKYKCNYIHVNFFVIDIVKAGDVSCNFFFDGDYSVEIMTGARIPSFFDTVVKIEDTFLNSNNPFEFFLKKILFFGENVRRISEDFKIGSVFVKKGDIFSLKDYVSTSTFGIKKLFFLKKIKVYLICTGNEIIDSFNLDFNNSVINNSLSNFFISFFKSMSIDLVYYGVSLDLKSNLKSKLSELLDKDNISLIITTGSVSKGKADILPAILSELNVNIIFHGVHIKPGKPILFANYLNKNYFFCLPGNPISAIIGLRFFVYPFIRHLTGYILEVPLKAFLESDYIINRNIDVFLKSFIYFSKNNFYVRIMDDQQSFKIHSFIESNSFVFLRANDTSKKGDILNVYFHKPF